MVVEGVAVQVPPVVALVHDERAGQTAQKRGIGLVAPPELLVLGRRQERLVRVAEPQSHPGEVDRLDVRTIDTAVRPLELVPRDDPEADRHDATGRHQEVAVRDRVVHEARIRSGRDEPSDHARAAVELVRKDAPLGCEQPRQELTHLRLGLEKHRPLLGREGLEKHHQFRLLVHVGPTFLPHYVWGVSPTTRPKRMPVISNFQPSCALICFK